MKLKTLLVTIAIIAPIGAAIYFFRDTEPLKTWIQPFIPTFNNLVKTVKDNLTMVMGMLTSAAFGLVAYLKTKFSTGIKQLQTQATTQISGLQTQINELTVEKTNLQTQIDGLTTDKSSLQQQLQGNLTMLNDSTHQLTKSQTMLQTANKRIEDLLIEIDTLKQRINFLEVNPPDGYIVKK